MYVIQFIIYYLSAHYERDMKIIFNTYIVIHLKFIHKNFKYHFVLSYLILQQLNR